MHRALAPLSFASYRKAPLLIAVLLVGIAAGACDEDVAVVPEPGKTADAAADGGPPPVPSPFGLDARPPNGTCVAFKRQGSAGGVKFVDAFPGITFSGAPMKFSVAPGDPNRFYVALRGFRTSGGSGNITTRVISFPKTIQSPSEISDFATVSVNPDGEGGLLGMAFHPNWQTNRTFFLSYTRTFNAGSDPDPAPEPNNGGLVSVVSKWTSTDNGQTVANPVEILKRVQPYTNHNGGNIAFGPDGYLYFGLGDGGSGNDPLNAGQTLTTLLGKMLRIDVDSASPYGIPPTNPFANGAGGARPEIYAYGFRNPFRWSFDRATGELWVGDVGQNAWEEIDRVEMGGNYGWKLCEGFHKRGSTTELCDSPGVKPPVVEHGRSEANSITGGVVYRGKAIPSFVGTYVYGDYAQGNIWGITYDAKGKASSRLLAKVSNVVDFGEDADGEIYLVQISGKILKMVVDLAPPPSTLPERLSLTGCVDPLDPKKPAQGLVPYSVRSPLWSDGASKERYLAIPDGSTITVGSDGDFDFPLGSVLVKNFSRGNKRLETRLFVRHDDGEWAGYSYEWDDAETDATLLPAGKVRNLTDGSTWAYPSRSQCLQCHTAAAGSSLGLEVGQLNGDAVYPATNRLSNQLATLEHIGLFATPLGDPSGLAKLPEPSPGNIDEASARSYLHSNCSHCHRPTGGGGGTIDLRYSIPFAATLTCNQDPVSGRFGPSDSKIVFPGSSAKSVLSYRMHATDATRMPPVGVRIVDADGTKLIDGWIDSLKACP